LDNVTIDKVSPEVAVSDEIADEIAKEVREEAHIYVDERGVPIGSTGADEPSPFVMIRRTTLNYVVIAAVFLLLGIFIGGYSAFRVERANRTWVSDAVSQAIDEQAETLANLVASSRPPSLDDTNSRFEVAAVSEYARGGADASVEIIEFGDFNCGYCGRFHHETLDPILEMYGENVRYVYRDYPILADSSVTAAIAARCAGEQGDYWNYHDLLFDNQGAIAQVGAFASFADQLGLDVDAFNTCVDEQAYLDPVIADYREAQSLGIRGTPAFFINGRPVVGAQPYESFATIINEELEANGIDTSEFAVPVSSIFG
jgi:protein-disulfide isomerase